MTAIDADVRKVAAQFGIDPALIQAVVNAEGNILRAVQCSFPTVTTREKALEITCRSAVHAMSDFLKARYPDEFVAMWGARWAPEGVENDPTHLNRFWVNNVRRFWIPGSHV